MLNELLDNMDDELLPEKIKTVTENISEISQWISSNSNTISLGKGRYEERQPTQKRSVLL